MKRLIVLTISLLLGLAPMGYTADVAMDALTDYSASVAGTQYAVGYAATTPYRWTFNSILGLRIVQAGANNILTYTGNYSLGLTLTGNTSVTLPESGTLLTTTGTPAAMVIASQATGDLLQASSATAWARLAAPAAGKLLRSGGTTTVSAWSTFTMADTFAQYSIPYASTANTLTALAPVNDSLIGYNSSGVLAAYTNHQHKDDAAQFASATASKGTWKMLMTSMSDGILGTFTPVCSGTCVFTNNTVGAGTYKYGLLEVAGTWSGQQTFVAPVLGAATATSLVATGRVDGLVGMLASTAGSALTISVSTHGSSSYFMNKGDSAAHSIYTLPTAAAGLQYCVKNYTGITQVLTLQTSASGQYVDLDGTLTASGGFVHSGGAAGDGICVVGVDATHWVAYPGKGTWTAD